MTYHSNSDMLGRYKYLGTIGLHTYEMSLLQQQQKKKKKLEEEGEERKGRNK